MEFKLGKISILIMYVRIKYGNFIIIMFFIGKKGVSGYLERVILGF